MAIAACIQQAWHTTSSVPTIYFLSPSPLWGATLFSPTLAITPTGGRGLVRPDDLLFFTGFGYNSMCRHSAMMTLSSFYNCIIIVVVELHSRVNDITLKKDQYVRLCSPFLLRGDNCRYSFLTSVDGAEPEDIFEEKKSKIM